MRKIACLAAVLALSTASCTDTKKLYPVSGRVTYHGSPASGAVVSFHPKVAAAVETPILGIVRDDGTFDLFCGALGKGAPPGDYDVRIEWKRVTSGKCIAGKCQRPQIGPDRLHGRYADPRHSRLHATVEAATNVLPPMELAE
jgi:hypothetical protein